MGNGIPPTSGGCISELHDPIGMKFIGDLDMALYHRAYNPKKRCDFVVSCRTPPRVGGCLLEIRILRGKP